jgi:predicted transcriptional regulator
MDREVAEIRREVARHVTGTQYRLELRRQVAAYGVTRRREGATWTAIAAEVGLNMETVRVWCLKALPPREEKTVALQAVEVVPDTRGSGLTVVSPAGIRVEGLTVETAAQLLRAIG